MLEVFREISVVKDFELAQTSDSVSLSLRLTRHVINNDDTIRGAIRFVLHGDG